MLQLHRAGLIVLPAKRKSVPNNAARHRAPLLEPPLEIAPLECSLAELGPLEIRQVRRTPEEALFGRLLQTYHYLGYRRPVGEHVKYLIYGQGQPVACLAWSSAPRHLGPRDRFIGWSAPQRQAHIHLLAYNTRFLILPWARVPHLASHLLARVARRISPIGSGSTGILFIGWRPSSNRPAFAALVIARPTGFAWAYHRPGQGRSDPSTQPLAEGTLGPAPGAELSRAALPGRP